MNIIAAIDIGANSMRMSIAEAHSDHIKILEKFVHPLRLGKDTFLKNNISPKALEETIKVLELFKNKLAEYGVTRYKIIATSAIRGIENQDFFIEQVRVKTGFNIEILEKNEEERLIFLGLAKKVENFTQIVDEGAIFVKVGSGNVEVSLVKSDEILFSRSIPIGGLRLREILKDVPERNFSEAMEKFIYSDVRMLKQSLPNVKLKYYVGSGTLLRKIYSIINPKTGYISFDELNNFYQEIKIKSISQISDKYNMPREYADLIVPATYVYLKLLKLADVNEILFVDISFVECLLLDRAGILTAKKVLTKKIWKAAVGVGEKYQFDKIHSLKVAKISSKLFDSLKSIHNLPLKYKLILRLAALWHDIGIFIQSNAHHKHSYYLISNIEIPGISRKDIKIIALIARYHRKALPKKYHNDYMALSEKNRVVVSKLASILRIADALDRSHCELLKDIKTEILGHNVTLHVSFKENAWIEKLYFEKKKNLFYKTFGIDIKLVEML